MNSTTDLRGSDYQWRGQYDRMGHSFSVIWHAGSNQGPYRFPKSYFESPTEGQESSADRSKKSFKKSYNAFFKSSESPVVGVNEQYAVVGVEDRMTRNATTLPLFSNGTADPNMTSSYPHTFKQYERFWCKFKMVDFPKINAAVFTDVQGTLEHKALIFEQNERPLRSYEDLSSQERWHYDQANSWRSSRHLPQAACYSYSLTWFCDVASASILKYGTERDKALAMQAFSGEILRQNPRPTMMLLYKFDDLQSETKYPTGWLVAFDPVKGHRGTYIVQRYAETENMGPYDMPWINSMPAQDDGITFYGEAEELSARILSNRRLPQGTPLEGFALLIRAGLAMHLLESSRGTQHKEASDLEAAHAMMMMRFHKLPFPRRGGMSSASKHSSSPGSRRGPPGSDYGKAGSSSRSGRGMRGPSSWTSAANSKFISRGSYAYY